MFGPDWSCGRDSTSWETRNCECQCCVITREECPELCATDPDADLVGDCTDGTCDCLL